MTSKIIPLAIAAGLLVTTANLAFAQAVGAAAPGNNGGRGGNAAQAGEPTLVRLVRPTFRPRVKRVEVCGEYKTEAFRKMCIANRING